MDHAIIGNPDRGNVSFTLAAGESVVVEADSMSFMTAGMEVKPTPRPGPASSRRWCNWRASRGSAALPVFRVRRMGGLIAAKDAAMMAFIHEKKLWPAFHWDEKVVLPDPR